MLYEKATEFSIRISPKNDNILVKSNMQVTIFFLI